MRYNRYVTADWIILVNRYKLILKSYEKINMLLPYIKSQIVE